MSSKVDMPVRFKTRLRRKMHDAPGSITPKSDELDTLRSKMLTLNTPSNTKTNVRTRVSSVNCMGEIRRPPTSYAPTTSYKRKVNNFNLSGLTEEFVTDAVYMGSGVRTPTKKKFRKFSHLTAKDDEDTIELTYIRNTRFLVRALSNDGTNIRVILDQAQRLNLWYVSVTKCDTKCGVSLNCPPELSKYLRVKE